MCGVIGFESDCLTVDQLSILKQVMIESQIRGKHASGIAWFDNEIKSFVKPIPISQLVEEFDWNNLKLGSPCVVIAHARYSTSDIRYNQPITHSNLAIAHNGVITQAPFETWYDKYGVKCTTKNDSELLLAAIEANHNIEQIFADSSISTVLILKNKLLAFRNGLRPLWKGDADGARIFASTYDILNCSNVKSIQKVETSWGAEYQARNRRSMNDYK